MTHFTSPRSSVSTRRPRCVTRTPRGHGAGRRGRPRELTANPRVHPQNQGTAPSGSRDVVERCFNKLKQWRGIATRYDKTTESYQAAVTLAALLMWACI
nr:transposase [Streptomyces sp. NRRL S-1022]